MEIKYIASDLDGTLLLEAAQDLEPEIFELILKLKEKGIRFIAASGRQYYNIRNLFRPVRDDISYIAENGSLCIHDGKVISRGVIDRELGIRIIEASREFPTCNCMLSCESRSYTDSTDSAFLDHMHNEVKYDILQVPDLKEIQEPFLKFAMFDFNGTEKSEKFFKDRFSSEITVVTSGNKWVDFIAPNANKGAALMRLTEYLGLSPEDGVVFGDQYNDIEMLSSPAKSYAMTTCAPGVEKYADCRTDNVAKVLREILGS